MVARLARAHLTQACTVSSRSTATRNATPTRSTGEKVAATGNAEVARNTKSRHHGAHGRQPGNGIASHGGGFIRRVRRYRHIGWVTGWHRCSAGVLGCWRRDRHVSRRCDRHINRRLAYGLRCRRDSHTPASLIRLGQRRSRRRNIGRRCWRRQHISWLAAIKIGRNSCLEKLLLRHTTRCLPGRRRAVASTNTDIRLLTAIFPLVEAFTR